MSSTRPSPTTFSLSPARRLRPAPSAARQVTGSQATSTRWQGLPPLVVAELTAPPGTGRHRRPNLVVHRSAVIEAAALPSSPDLMVTTPVTTIADLAGALPRWRLLAVCDSAVRGRQVSCTSLVALATAWTGRPGAVALREVASLADGRSESAFESRFRLILVDAGLPTPVLQLAVNFNGRNYRLDFAYPMVKVAIEVDGRGVHTLPEALLEDRRRQNALQNAGWLVLRFTWDDVVHHPERVLAEVLAALRQRGMLPIEA